MRLVRTKDLQFGDLFIAAFTVPADFFFFSGYGAFIVRVALDDPNFKRCDDHETFYAPWESRQKSFLVGAKVYLRPKHACLICDLKEPYEIVFPQIPTMATVFGQGKPQLIVDSISLEEGLVHPNRTIRKMAKVSLNKS